MWQCERGHGALIQAFDALKGKREQHWHLAAGLAAAPAAAVLVVLPLRLVAIWLPAMATMASLVKPLPGLAVAPSPPTSRASLSGKPSLSLRVPGGRVSTRAVRFVVKASKTEDFGSAADAAGNSVVQEVAALPEEAETEGISSTVSSSSSSSSTPASRKPSPLQKGGTLDGKEAAGKAPAAATLGKASPLATSSGKFDDPRWKNGTWDISMFASADGKTDWDAVIDAGMCVCVFYFFYFFYLGSISRL